MMPVDVLAIRLPTLLITVGLALGPVLLPIGGTVRPPNGLNHSPTRAA